MSRPDVLFWTHDWDAVVAGQRSQLRTKAYALAAADLAGGPEVIAAALVEEFALAVPEIFPERLTLTPGAASGEPTRDFALLRAAATREAVFQARLPYTGDPAMFAVRPLTYGRTPPPGRVGAGFLEVSIAGNGLTAEAAAAHVRNWPAAIGDWLRRQADSIGSYPADLQRLASTVVRQRAEELSAEIALWVDLELVRPPSRRAG